MDPVRLRTHPKSRPTMNTPNEVATREICTPPVHIQLGQCMAVKRKACIRLALQNENLDSSL